MPNWEDVLEEIRVKSNEYANKANGTVDEIRRSYLEKLYTHTERNIIAYYSGFLSKPGIAQSQIMDEDKNGFMMSVHKLDRSKGLDLILHTPGGELAATESMVNYLHKMFGNDIRAIIPQIAMSGGTMIACSCKKILMGAHSNIGPIDPHLSGIPAIGVIEEFARAYEEMKKDAAKIEVWRPILSKYMPTFLGQCENVIEWSKEFVTEQLTKVMFEAEPKGKEKAEKIVGKLTDFSGNRTHDRHIHLDECKKMGLKVQEIESAPELQDLVLTVHHCYMHSLMNSTAYKIIENHLGAALIKHQSPNAGVN